MEWLSGKKTYFVAAAVVLTSVASFISGDASLREAVVTALEGLGLATLRMGVSKV